LWCKVDGIQTHAQLELIPGPIGALCVTVDHLQLDLESVGEAASLPGELKDVLN